MEPEQFLEELSTFAQSEGGVQKLRELILQLAVQGKLVPQDPNDEPAGVLLERIAAEKARLVKEKKIRKPKMLPPIEPDEVPFAMPEGWAATRFSDLGAVLGGKTPSKSNPSYWTGGVPWVSPKDMKYPVIEHSIDEVSPKAVSDGLALLPKGSVLIVVRSGILRHTVPVAVTAVECTINQDIGACLLPEVVPAYIRRMVQGFQSFILANLTKTGTTVESMKVAEFFSQPFPLPLAEQHRIVAKVDALMGLCDQLEQSQTAAMKLQERQLLLQPR